MKLVRHSMRDRTILPELALALRAFPGDDGLELSSAGLGNALGPYVRTFDQLVYRIEACLKEVEAIVDAPFDDEGRLSLSANGLPDSIHGFHAALTAHGDVLGKIWRELRNHHQKDDPQPRSAFAKSVENLKDTIGRRLNQVKHGGAVYSPTVKYDEKYRVPGYVVVNTLNGGLNGPDPNAHPSGTAVSLPRELRMALIWPYWVSNVVLTLMPGLAPEFDDVDGSRLGNDQVVEVAKRLNALPNFIYPSEAGFPVPLVDGAKKGSGERLSLSTTTKLAAGLTYGWASVVQYKSDGVSNSFRFKMFGDDKESKQEFLEALQTQRKVRDEVHFA